MIASVSRQPAQRRGAFTLLEVLVVVAILVILASVGTISVLKYLEESKMNRATADMQMLYKSCKAYYINTNQWPQTLDELVTPQGGGRPYIEQGSALTDPWGKAYQYSMRQSPTTGEEEPYISTTSGDGLPISWPRQ
jgi:general secretion pathway protein G